MRQKVHKRVQPRHARLGLRLVLGSGLLLSSSWEKTTAVSKKAFPSFALP